MQRTPRSRATSCTANDPDDASPSINSSQPLVLKSSRANARGFLRLSLGVSDHHLDLPPSQAACGIDLLDFERDRVPRRGAELCDPAGQYGRHSDLDGLGVTRHPTEPRTSQHRRPSVPTSIGD
jgi:hypothetical protein